MEGCVLQRKTYEARAGLPTPMALSFTRPNALPELRRVLVVGGGGREHALSWALQRSESLERVCITLNTAQVIPDKVTTSHTDRMSLDSLLASGEIYKGNLFLDH